MTTETDYLKLVGENLSLPYFLQASRQEQLALVQQVETGLQEMDGVVALTLVTLSDILLMQLQLRQFDDQEIIETLQRIRSDGMIAL